MVVFRFGILGCAFLVTALLAGCGWQSTRSTQAAEAFDFSQVYINPISDRNGQLLRNELSSRMNPRGEPTNPRYILSVTLRVRSQGLGVRTNGDTSRSLLVLTAVTTLNQAEDNASLAKKTYVEKVSYSQVVAKYVDTYPTRAATERGIDQMADRIIRELGLQFESQRQGRAILREML